MRQTVSQGQSTRAEAGVGELRRREPVRTLICERCGDVRAVASGIDIWFCRGCGCKNY